MKWTLEQIANKLKQLKKKGFIGIPDDMYRYDEGVVGQILEREFRVQENNLKVGDLGDFELKGMRIKSNTLTLCHKSPDKGLKPIPIFERFGYIKPSRRDGTLKKKLFTTVNGKKPNSLKLKLIPGGATAISMQYQEEFICEWDLTDSLEKIDKVILVFAETQGNTGASDEKFHYTRAFLLNGLRNIGELVSEGNIVIDFCIDQKIDSDRAPHDRGPHIRIPKSKLLRSYREVITILE